MLPINNIQLRDYQEEAIQNWVKADYVGFFEMATGTGKTITALSCAKYLVAAEGRVCLLILVPTLDLASQWKHDVKNIICRNIVEANSNSPDWYEKALMAIYEQRDSYCIIATYATFLSNRFQYIVSKISPKCMLIADEAHNFGSNSHKAQYPSHIERRLGLSATPDRHFDEDGTRAVMNYFNAVEAPTFEFNMAEAIRRGYLCEYYYHPIIVHLNDDELSEYKIISKKLFKYFTSQGSFNDSPAVTALLLKRKRIIHQAVKKFDALRHILKDLKRGDFRPSHVLVYVPEGNDKNEEAVDKKLIDEYSRIISIEFGLRQHQFIGQTTGRNEILGQFSDGKIEVLTAMKCLDEGVDIKRAETAIFCASTGNPRQFIQRRGRVLRTHPDKKFAVIYDMIVVPASKNESFEGSLSMEKSILQGELKRVHEFAGLALNHYQALYSLEEVAREYELDIYSKT